MPACAHPRRQSTGASRPSPRIGARCREPPGTGLPRLVVNSADISAEVRSSPPRSRNAPSDPPASRAVGSATGVRRANVAEGRIPRRSTRSATRRAPREGTALMPVVATGTLRWGNRCIIINAGRGTLDAHRSAVRASPGRGSHAPRRSPCSPDPSRFVQATPRRTAGSRGDVVRLRAVVSIGAAIGSPRPSGSRHVRPAGSEPRLDRPRRRCRSRSARLVVAVHGGARRGATHGPRLPGRRQRWPASDRARSCCARSTRPDLRSRDSPPFRRACPEDRNEPPKPSRGGAKPSAFVLPSLHSTSPTTALRSPRPTPSYPGPADQGV